MADPIAAIALVVSIGTFAFVLLEKGIGFLLGYRESELTQNRKKEIDAKLRSEVDNDLKKFLDSLTKEDRDEDTELENLVELGQSAYFARSLTDNMLRSMTRYMGQP